MPLNELFEKSKETIKSMEIAQLVAIAGGPKRLKDNTETQKDLRDAQLNALPENNDIITETEDEAIENEATITSGTQITAQAVSVGSTSTSGGSSGGGY